MSVNLKYKFIYPNYHGYLKHLYVPPFNNVPSHLFRSVCPKELEPGLSEIYFPQKLTFHYIFFHKLIGKFYRFKYKV